MPGQLHNLVRRQHFALAKGILEFPLVNTGITACYENEQAELWLCFWVIAFGRCTVGRMRRRALDREGPGAFRAGQPKKGSKRAGRRCLLQMQVRY